MSKQQNKKIMPLKITKDLYTGLLQTKGALASYSTQISSKTYNPMLFKTMFNNTQKIMNANFQPMEPVLKSQYNASAEAAIAQVICCMQYCYNVTKGFTSNPQNPSEFSNVVSILYEDLTQIENMCKNSFITP